MAQEQERRRIQSKLHARARATLTFATVAASASLLILALVWKDPAQIPEWIRHIGFMFSVSGGYTEKSLSLPSIELTTEKLVKGIHILGGLHFLAWLLSGSFCFFQVQLGGPFLQVQHVLEPQ